MSETTYTCGCVEVNGVFTVDCGSHNDSTNPSPKVAAYDRTHHADGTLRDPQGGLDNPNYPNAPAGNLGTRPDAHRRADGTLDLTQSVPEGETRGPAVPPVAPAQESEAERQRSAHASADPAWYADETPGAKVRRLEAEAELAKGQEPKDTRTPAEKKADAEAAEAAEKKAKKAAKS